MALQVQRLNQQIAETFKITTTEEDAFLMFSSMAVILFFKKEQ
jgi:hypothetical protein